MVSGGLAVNIIIGVSYFGGNVFYFCKVVNDLAGDFYVQDLVVVGVDINLYRQWEDGVSGKCIVLIMLDVECIMQMYLGIFEIVLEVEL